MKSPARISWTHAVAGMNEARDTQIEWSSDGVISDDYFSPIVSVATLAQATANQQTPHDEKSWGVCCAAVVAF